MRWDRSSAIKAGLKEAGIRVLSDAERETIKQRRAAGEAAKALAAEYGVSDETIWRVTRKPKGASGHAH